MAYFQLLSTVYSRITQRNTDFLFSSEVLTLLELSQDRTSQGFRVHIENVEPGRVNVPEEDQVLLVLVLPQKRHQAVELVLCSADLKHSNIVS